MSHTVVVQARLFGSIPSWDEWLMNGLVIPMLSGVFWTFDPLTSTSVPAVWSTHGLEDKFELDARFISSVFLECLIGTIFGIIHYAAWHAYFPSTDEMLLWQASALVVILMPLVAAVGETMLESVFSRMYPNVKGVLMVIRNVVACILIPAYVVARIILCALAFTTLRALPPNAFVDVNWTTYIPHL
ncbi:hypothetical protein C8R45DRAFT_1170730 [Mycena sanguinolenta]|nr:hypothetical protein C8R45DRAFT_1170730 [Mycena sanguinolenta]